MYSGVGQDLMPIFRLAGYGLARVCLNALFGVKNHCCGFCGTACSTAGIFRL